MSAMYCLALSFQASAFYTVARITGSLVLALIRVASVYPLKFILDGLSQQDTIQMVGAAQWLLIMA